LFRRFQLETVILDGEFVGFRFRLRLRPIDGYVTHVLHVPIALDPGGSRAGYWHDHFPGRLRIDIPLIGVVKAHADEGVEISILLDAEEALALIAVGDGFLPGIEPALVCSWFQGSCRNLLPIWWLGKA
jgi:hypothetical protein